jgi:nucleoside-diphosphate-sugar epimerase
MTKRIVFTGGTGKAGRHAVPHLLAKGYSILNVDLKPLDLPGVNTLVADLIAGKPSTRSRRISVSMALSAAKRRARRTPLCISRQSRAC